MRVVPGNPLWHVRGMRAASWRFFAYLYLPIVVLIVLSFNENRLATIWSGFSTQWYGVVLGNDEIISAATNSLVVATVATLAATIAATLAALGMAKGRFRGADGISGLLVLPLVVPEVVTAVAPLLFFILVGLRLGLTTVTVAHTVFFIPFPSLPIRAPLEGLYNTLGQVAAAPHAP